MELSVFDYVDADRGTIICCCLKSDFEKYADTVVGRSHVIKGFSFDRDGAISDCLVNLTLNEDPQIFDI